MLTFRKGVIFFHFVDGLPPAQDNIEATLDQLFGLLFTRDLKYEPPEYTKTSPSTNLSL